ncbi:MAG: CIA30 family protein [Leptolyngbyaceae bacterium]|nr:CIA30 family protein [Leptolyngbyaceae bacterium]
MSQSTQPQSKQWNLCRFLRTLAYFGAVPFFSGFQWFQQFWDSSVNPQADQQAIAYGQGESDSAGSPKTPETNDLMEPSPTSPRLVFDFRSSDSDIESIWGAVDDVVMGGVSQSGLTNTAEGALFSGVVSTNNSGGFASVRTRNFEPPLNLQGYTGIELRVRGDGNRYKFILRDETRWDGVGYSHSFDTEADTWTTVQIPFTDFVPVFRARTVSDGQQVDPSQLRAFQVMLSKFEYDGNLNPTFEPGEFQLLIETIRAY